MQLYTYFRSSAAYRVRIALHLKGLDFTAIPLHLVRGGGEQHSAAYRARNPAGFVPTLIDRDFTLTQSLAIMEYLEEIQAQPPLLPVGAAARARVRALAATIACDIHPLNNLRVLRYLNQDLGIDEGRRNDWYRHWIASGFAALESLLVTDAPPGRYSHGDEPTIADCCLVPQVANARRLDCPLTEYPRIVAVERACLELEAFRKAAPSAQADAD